MISGAYDRHDSELASLLATHPDFIKNGTESTPSGRQVDGADTYWRMVTKQGNLGTGAQGIAHNIPLISRVLNMYGIARRDNASKQDITFPHTDLAANGIHFLGLNETHVVISVGSGYTGAGNTLSKLRIFMEYTIDASNSTSSMRNAYVESAASIQARANLSNANQDLVDGVEVASGREIGGVATYVKMIKRTGDLSTGLTSVAHGITGLIKMYSCRGITLRDSADDSHILLANSDENPVAVNNLATDDTNILITIGTVWTGVGNVLSEALIFMEYTKA